MQFTKLHIAGFKSFAEPQDVLIEPGLTGIVGPNGCGKSNIVEALRWVMGETSAKQLRGSGMDDVIFGGTGSETGNRRPARNLAKVVVHLDNSDKKAPPAYNEHDEIEIIRLIERGVGSAYKINGRDVRAKDVQLLFADAVTGSNSTAIVSQGRIGQIISAKPKDRRHLLEEAAGIVGLHSRRHEAELKLRSAEKNLERVDDILGALKSQQRSLKKQERHARGYKKLQAEIRKLQAVSYHLRWQEFSEKKARQENDLRQLERSFADLTGEHAKLEKKREEIVESLDPLRKKEAEASAELQRITLSYRELENRQNRLEQEKQQTEERLAECRQDLKREQDFLAEYEFSQKGLQKEKQNLESADSHDKELQEKKQRVDHQSQKVEELENMLADLTSQLAAQEESRRNLHDQISALEQRRDTLAREQDNLKNEKQELEQTIHDRQELVAARNKIATAEQSLNKCKEEVEHATNEATAQREQLENLRHNVSEAASRLTSLKTEKAGLEDVLSKQAEASDASLINKLQQTESLEAAISAGIGDGLLASTDNKQSHYWHNIKSESEATLPPLPSGATSLSQLVKAPDVLKARLSQIGLVNHRQKGDTLWPRLKPGQRLVTKEGDLWRWDGYKSTAEKTRAETVNLKNRNRVRQLDQEINTAEAKHQKLESQLKITEENYNGARNNEQSARAALDQAYLELDKTRTALSELENKYSEQNQQLSNIKVKLEQNSKALEELTTDLVEKKNRLEQLADGQSCEEEITQQRETLATERTTLYDLRSDYDALFRSITQRDERVRQIIQELDALSTKKEQTLERQKTLQDREQALQKQLKEIEQSPDSIAEQRQKLLDKMEACEHNKTAAANALQEQEQTLRSCEKDLKEQEQKLSALREERGRLQASQSHSEEFLATLQEEIFDALSCTPAQIIKTAGLEHDDLDTDSERVHDALNQARTKREGYGAVNLMAEQELADVSTRVTTLETEREDLIKAIQKLRTGINSLNKEGRERLLKSFEDVNGHFQTLFKRLFGGGKAHLTLVEEEDPLEAGIEIMASPPGKRLQSLSLLSGGERALAATALLFAVFLTNPAPICVLDEVDAPLDDTNVDRFCTLVEEIAKGTQTRFILITHHRMTMARMNRLYGVTMAEPGVSQLVSVNLEQAETIRATA